MSTFVIIFCAAFSPCALGALLQSSPLKLYSPELMPEQWLINFISDKIDYAVKSMSKSTSLVQKQFFNLDVHSPNMLSFMGSNRNTLEKHFSTLESNVDIYLKMNKAGVESCVACSECRKPFNDYKTNLLSAASGAYGRLVSGFAELLRQEDTQLAYLNELRSRVNSEKDFNNYARDREKPISRSAIPRREKAARKLLISKRKSKTFGSNSPRLRTRVPKILLPRLTDVETFFFEKNEDAADRVAQTSRESSACVRKEGPEAAIRRVDEENIRLRRKLDLVKYQSDKQQSKLASLLEEYEELVNGRRRKTGKSKLEHPLKKKIISLENQLQRVSVMQMEADTVRKKYRNVRSNLKADAASYVSSLRNLENSIREQEIEIKQLQNVKEEAIELRDTTKETLTKQEIEAMNTSKARDLVILDYRQRVEDRKLELERLERMIFPASRQLPREDFEASGETATTKVDENGDCAAKDEVTRLEEAFVKLRSATGVTRTEDVLDRFLSQRETKEKLQKMRTVTENEKMNLERKRQKLTAEIESQKFSETKNADENAEELESLNRRISEELERRRKALSGKGRTEEISSAISRILWKFCDLLRDVSDSPVPVDPQRVTDSGSLFEMLEEKINCCIEIMGGLDKYSELMDRALADGMENLSNDSKSENEKIVHAEERPLFPLFPGRATPAVPAQASEDEEDVPTRNVLKRQAQLLVDTKSRRKEELGALRTRKKSVKKFSVRKMLEWAYDGVNPAIPRNVGPECANFLTPYRRILETILATTLIGLCLRWGYKRMVFPKAVTYASPERTGRKWLLVLMTLILGIEIGFKFTSRTIVYLLNPCHITTAVQLYLLSAKPSPLVTTIFRLHLNFLNGPVLAYLFPEIESRHILPDKAMYYLQHGLMLVIPYYLLRVGGAYNVESRKDLSWSIFAYGINLIYHWWILQAAAMPVQVNLSHILCPAILDPFGSVNYRIWAIIHQGLLCPLLCKLFVTLADYFITQCPLTKVKSSLELPIDYIEQNEKSLNTNENRATSEDLNNGHTHFD
ncbi:uncharacterized protein [Venturia canescens]|uniref:uncharacterized protein isoform X3 n=1 Tax=Venturia canescens TaxID=32260 RepID=UPI001C9CAC19|nr:uncharacterized protein LOC122411451 isoform X3 [Venturia canescens]